jgi:autotransporter-associated beta strand protein
MLNLSSDHKFYPMKLHPLITQSLVPSHMPQCSNFMAKFPPRFRPWALVLGAVIPTTWGHAADIIWNGLPVAHEWNTVGYWNPQSVPGFGDTAMFNPSPLPFEITIQASVDIDKIQFNGLSGQPYHFTLLADPVAFGGSLSIYGAGIINAGGPPNVFGGTYPLFTTKGGLPQGGAGKIFFHGNATVGEPFLFINEAAPFVLGISGATTFSNGSSAGLAFVTNSGGKLGGVGGFTSFQDDSTAGESHLDNQPGTGINDTGGATQFSGHATAGSAVIANHAGAISVPDPNFPDSRNGARGGGTSFSGHSSADQSRIGNGGSAKDGSTGGFLVFSEFASAGFAEVRTTGGIGPQVTFSDANYFNNNAAGSVVFRDSSTAAFGTFLTFGGLFNGWGGKIDFHDNSTAALGNFTNYGGGDTLSNGAAVTFHDSSTAGHATFLNGGSAALAREAGQTRFLDNTSAGTATITNAGSKDYNINATSKNGFTVFYENSTAGDATIINQDSFTGTVPARTVFFDHSTAGNATLTSLTGGALGQGGAIIFMEDSTGGTATVNLFGNGSLDISLHQPTGVTIGSLNGDGIVFLGGNRLTLGSNDADTIFTGNIYDGGLGGGVGGSITKIGTGALILNGKNTFTGGTLIQGGTLITNDTEAFIHGPTRLNPGTFLKPLNGNFNVILGSSITGGSVVVDTVFTKNGPGTLVTNTAFKVAELANINAGKLVVNGSIQVPQLVINHGGQLGGSGIIIGNVFNSGIVAPGNSPGTLRIAGNYTQTKQGTLAIEIASTKSYDRLAVSGTAKLSGTLALSTGNYRPQRGDHFKILTASKVTGEFTNVINPFPQQPGSLLYLGVDYTKKAVIVQTKQNTFANALSIFKLTNNQLSTAAALDSALLDVRQDAVLEHLDTENIGLVPGDLDRIAPEELTAIFTLGFGQVSAQNSSLEQRFAEVRAQNATLLPTQEHAGVWLTQSGDFTDQGGTPNAPGYESKSSITSLGMDFRASDRLILGFTGGYGHTKIDLFDDGQLTVDGGRASLYGMYARPNGLFAQGVLGFGSSQFHTRRAGLEGDASGRGSLREFDAETTLGFDFKLKALTLTPMVTMRYTHAGLSDFGEAGSLQPLDYPNQSQSSLLTRIGLRAAYEIKAGATTITPYTSLQWQHEALADELSITSKFANGSGDSFKVHGPSTGQDSMLVSAGINFAWSSYALYLAYQADLGRKNYEEQSLLLGIRMTW